LLSAAACGNASVREEETPSAALTDELAELPVEVNRGVWLIGNKYPCRQDRDYTLNCLRTFSKLKLDAALVSIVRTTMYGIPKIIGFTETKEVIGLHVDGFAQSFREIEAMFAVKPALVLLREDRCLHAISLPPKATRFDPEPVPESLFPLTQSDFAERSACMLGNATLACFSLPLSSTFECAGCECGGCEPPGPISDGVLYLGEGYWTESEVFRPDLKWRSRSADWRAFDGADDLDNDGVYFLDPPLCALDREDGTWRCGHVTGTLALASLSQRFPRASDARVQTLTRPSLHSLSTHSWTAAKSSSRCSTRLARHCAAA
jgi:hypothetical protein